MSKGYTVGKRETDGVKLLILRPTINAKERAKTPGILWIHGGGYVTGMAGMVFISRTVNLVKKYGAVVISPEYRLAGRAPYPAAPDDCYKALLFLKNKSAELGCNENQIMVGGESAGGGLTAALCIYARGKKEVKIAFQMPLYPMLDDRDTESSKDNHGISWNTIHGSKGEEYDNVALIIGDDFQRNNRFFKDFFSYYKNMQKEDECKKARNLLYVACTRAKYNLYVLYTDDISDIKENIKEIFRVEINDQL